MIVRREDGGVTAIRVEPATRGAQVTSTRETTGRPRCFLLMTTEKDCSSAARHGDVVVVFPDGEPRASIWSDEFVGEALNRMDVAGFDPSRDMLLVAGNLVATVTVACALARDCEVGPTLLFFDAARQGYVPRAVPGGEA